MTRQEQAEILKAVSSHVHLEWSAHDRNGLVKLTAGPCPLYLDNACSVYAVRPYVCRRFACGRPDVVTEPYESGGPMGCYNLSDRVEQSLRFTEWYRSAQRRAQREWGEAHGWHKGMT